MAWISPTGHNDPNGKWGHEADAYDSVLGTYALNEEEGYYLELTRASISCDKVRIYCLFTIPVIPQESDADIDIDVYYSDAWHNIFSGTVTKNTWVEKAIGSTQDVTAARVKCNDDLEPDLAYFYLYEFEFWKTPETHEGVATLSGTGTLAGIGAGIFAGIATLSGSGTLAGIGHIAIRGTAALSGAGSLSAKAVYTVLGKATLAGVGTLATIGRLFHYIPLTLEYKTLGLTLKVKSLALTLLKRD